MVGSSAAGKVQASYPIIRLDLSVSAMGTLPLEGNGTITVLMLTFLLVFIFNSYKCIALALQSFTSTPLHFSSMSTSVRCSSSFSFIRYHVLPYYRIGVTGFLFSFLSSCVDLYNIITSLPLALPALSLLSADPNSDHLKQS